MRQDELKHYGVKGMKWGVRRAAKKQAKKVKRINDKARKTGRVYDIGSPNVIGARQKNGDVLFVNRKTFNEKGIDVAEKEAYESVRKTKSKQIKKDKAKVNKIIESEEKTLVKDMLKNYDTSDPDSSEAKKVLEEILESL